MSIDLLRLTHLYPQFVILLGILVLNACGQQREQSIQFYDEKLEQEVVKMLESKNILFRREGDMLWYPIDDREIVEDIFNHEVARRPIQYKFYDKEKKNKFLSMLANNKIVGESDSRIDSPYAVYVPNENRDEAGRLFLQVIKIN